MNTSDVQDVQVIVHSEIRVPMMVNFGSRITPTSAMIAIETGNSTVIADVHNVPEDVLDQLMRDGRVERIVIVNACEIKNRPALVLSKVTIDNVEYYLKP